MPPPPQKKKTTNPNCPPKETPVYANLPPADRAGATENFGKAHFLSANIAYYYHSPVNFAKISVSSLIPKPLTQIYHRRFRPSEIYFRTEHTTYPQTPIFSALFWHHNPEAGIRVRKPCMNLNKTKSRFSQLFGAQVPLEANWHQRSQYFEEKHTPRQSWQMLSKTLIIFIAANERWTNQLTSLWTTS